MVLLFLSNIYYLKSLVASIFILEMLIFGLIIWWTVKKLNQSEREKQLYYQQLSESENRFQAIFNQTFQFTGLLRPDGTLLEANQTALDFGGIAKSDVVDKPFWEAYWWQISPQTQVDLRAAIAKASKGEFVRYPVRVQGKDNVITIDFSLRPIKDKTGSVYLIIPEGRDISDRIEIEEALQKSEARYKAIVEDQTELICRYRQNGTVSYVNDAFCRYFGIDKAELIDCEYTPVVYEEDREKVSRLIASMTRDNPTITVENRVWAKGEVCWTQWNNRMIFDETGQFIEYQAVGRDISSLKEIEAKLNNLVEELERSNQELDEFASVVSHDLISPLRKQYNLIELLLENRAALGSEGEKYLNKIADYNSRMEKLVRSILTYARITTQAQPFVAVSLNQLLDDVLYDLESEIELAEAQIEIEQLPTIQGDRLQLRQLFLNLLQNALKYRSPNRKVRVKISYQLQADWHQISVADNGIGFESEHKNKIFSPFHRLHSPSKYEGTGLGLAICDKIIKRHKGNIFANSQLERGTSLIVTLPKDDN